MITEYYNLGDEELAAVVADKVNHLRADGYHVEFGTIGVRTTYCFIYKGDMEIVGYTYIRGDLSKKRYVLGQYKSLMQAINRKYLLYDSVKYDVKGDTDNGCQESN